MHVAPDITDGNNQGMELLVTLALLVLLAMTAARWGVDSRPADVDRPTSWWPATPRD